MDPQEIIQCLVVYVVCILFNALCVTGKFAFAQLRREYIEELIRDGDIEAKGLLPLYDHPDLFLGAAQVGMTLSNLVAGATIWYTLGDAYMPLVQHFHSPLIVWLIFFVICLVLLLILWVCGELIPKSIGLQYAERSLKQVGNFIFRLSTIFKPFIYLGQGLGMFMLRNKDFDVTNELEVARSGEEIRMLVTASHKEGKIDKVESELIGNVFDFADRLAKEIMVPRQDIVCLYTDASMTNNLNTIRQSRHTRYPLCEGDKDHVLGLVHIKDLMDLYVHKRSNLHLIKRPILMVPEIMPASKLLQLMRVRRTYLAIVVDEYGSTVGLIGLEDILEELVGNIKNEHSVEKEEIQALGDGSYEFDGTVLLEDVEEMLHIPVDEDVDTDTIGGYVFDLLGHTPELNDEVRIGTYRFVIIELQRFRIARVRAIPLPPEELEKPGDDTKDTDEKSS